MNKKIILIGCGNAGGQVANLAVSKYPDLFDAIYINSSDADLSMVEDTNSLKFKIGDKDKIEGSGKNRAKMKEYLKHDINKILENTDLQKAIASKKYCYIISSAAGGTGSGATPVLTDIFRQMFPNTNFILVGILPSLSSSLMEQGNALEFLTELYDHLGSNTTYMMYDNETAADLPPIAALNKVNENIVEDLRVLSGVDNFSTPYESIDEADLESIITTPGRLLVTRITSGITEKAMEDNNLDDIIIKGIKSSSHAETDRNKMVVRSGIITYFTNEVNNLYNPKLDKLNDFIGQPVERFHHNAINKGNEKLNFIYLIASGLSPINDRVERITLRIDELKAMLASADANRYILSGEGESYSTAEDRKKADRVAQSANEINPMDIFKKFM